MVALGTLLGSVFSSLRLSEVNESTAAASQALRGILENMNAMSFEDVLAAYNSDPADDPDPDRDYREELRVGETRCAGENGQCAVAEVSFSGLDPDTGEWRKDLVLRDLNGDDQIDSGNHAGDHRILPVSVRLEWQGPSGPQVLELATLLRR